MRLLLINCIGFISIICQISIIDEERTPLGLSLNYLLRTSSSSGNSDVQRYKQTLYNQNRKIVQKHNANQSKTYQMQLNQFAIITQEETKGILSLIPSIQPAVKLAKKISNLSESDRPTFSVLQLRMIFGVSIFNSQIPQFEEPEEQTIEDLQSQVLNQLTAHLRNRNKNDSEIAMKIENRSLSNETLANFNNNPRIPRRFLQQEVFVKNDNFFQQFNVDWSCISGQIRYQGVCGSCYAIAAADSLSAIMSIYYYTFYVPLSVQELLDCAKNSMVLGCDGGFLEGAFAYMASPGIVSQFAYPYTDLSSSRGTSGSCTKFSGFRSRFKISNFIGIPKGDCYALKVKLKMHPIAIGISARRLLLYKEGVFDGCLPKDVEDHAVLLIGYSDKKGWKIKNSWGVRWGQNGYAWVADGNSCRICDMAFYPVPNKGFYRFNDNAMIKQCPQP